MAKVIVINRVMLDGVMPAPGRRDEDARDGFATDGWAAGLGYLVEALSAARSNR